MSTKFFKQTLDGLEEHYPQKPPIYDIEKSYLDNLRDGPIFDAPIPKREFPAEEKWIDFLGHRIASPLGVPAGPLLAANWVEFAAKMGFDLLTYKTMRCTPYSAHPVPNMIYVKTGGQIYEDNPSEPAVRIYSPPKHITDLAVTNSFGNPSMSPEFLMEDIDRANKALAPGQLMMVSIYGYPHDGVDSMQDFINTAIFAKKAGAKVIEANFSCPNVDAKEGCLYMTPDLVYDLSKKISEAISPIPLVIKVGLFPNTQLLREVMIAAARGGVQGFCGINTIKMKALDASSNPALGENRLHCGICGGVILDASLQFTKDAYKILTREKLDMTLLSTGGVTLPEHFDTFLDAGAKITMSAAGMMWDPYLAMRYHRRKNHG